MNLPSDFGVSWVKRWQFSFFESELLPLSIMMITSLIECDSTEDQKVVFHKRNSNTGKSQITFGTTVMK